MKAIVTHVTQHHLLVLLVEVLTIADLTLRVNKQTLSQVGALGRYDWLWQPFLV